MKKVTVKVKTDNDLDGVGVGILAKLAFLEQVEVTYCSRDRVNEAIQKFVDKKINNDVSLYVTDIAVDEQGEHALNHFYLNGGFVRLFDHHLTATHLNDYPWANVLTEIDGHKVCATSLFYNYLVTEKKLIPTDATETFVELVRLYDTWEWEKEGRIAAKHLNDLLYIMGIKRFEASMCKRLTEEEGKFEMTETEELLLELEETKIERYVRQKQSQLIETYVDPYYVGVVHLEQYHSEVGNRLGGANPHLDAIILVNTGAKRISMRTIHDHVDVAALAKRYNGGGHKMASGSPLTGAGFNDYVIPLFYATPRKKDAKKNKYNKRECKYGVLYENNEGEFFWIHAQGNKWLVKGEENKLKETFVDYDQAEYFLKRTRQVGLAEDEALINRLSAYYGIKEERLKSQFERAMDEAVERKGYIDE